MYSSSSPSFMRTAAVLGAVMLGALTAVPAEGGERDIRFDNNTGQNANDLHVKLKQGSTPQRVGGTYGAFTNWTGVDGGSNHDFDGGDVADGGNTTIRFKSGSPKIEVKQWYWTLDGRQIGNINIAAGMAVVFDGGGAVGDGAMLISTGGLREVFELRPRETPAMASQRLESFFDIFVWPDLDLIHTSRHDDTTVLAEGNLLGNPELELTIEILRPDSGIAIELVPLDLFSWPTLEVAGPCPGRVTLTVSHATPNGPVAFIYSTRSGETMIPQCPGVWVDLRQPTIAGLVQADPNGSASLSGNVPAQGCELVLVQAVDVHGCRPTNVTRIH